MQQQLAVRFLITVWGIMLRPLAAHSQSIDKWISGEEEVPREVRTVYLAFLECEFGFEKSPSFSVLNIVCSGRSCSAGRLRHLLLVVQSDSTARLQLDAVG